MVSSYHHHSQRCLAQVYFTAGQIFCLRCASNTIEPARYGCSGTIRACNLCLEISPKVEDNDDLRPVVSGTVPPFVTHNPSDPYSLARYTSPPFSTSQVQMTNQQPDPADPLSIAETKSGTESHHSPVGSTDTPYDRDGDLINIHTAVVPFRWGLSNDEIQPTHTPISGHERSLSAQSPKLPVEFPIVPPVSGNGAIRSRISSSGPEPGWRTRGGDAACVPIMSHRIQSY